MKRFTETQKWQDNWFRKLPVASKLFWYWILDHCDQAGVIDPDYELACFQIGAPVDEGTLATFGDRLQILPSGKVHIVKFVQYQYGKLSRSCKPHMPVYAALEKHGIDEEGVIQNPSYKNTVDDYVKEKVLARDGLRCVYYDVEIEREDAVIDHIHPRSKGGGVQLSNLVVCSRSANSAKWDKSVHRFCLDAELDVEAVFQRLSMATGKPINDFIDPTIGYLGSLKEKEKDKEKDKVKEKEEEPPPFPSPEFAKAWELWERHRRDQRKKITPDARKMQFRRLADMGESRAIAALEFSVLQGYQGIYEQHTNAPKQQGGKHAGIEENIDLPI